VKVRDVIKRLEDDGWAVVRQRGSHRQFKHPAKTGLVTVAGKPADDLAPGTLNSVFEAGRVKTVKYLIVIEATATGYSAYSPDVPGCVATGDTPEDVERQMKHAIRFHLDGLKHEGMKLPEPHTSSAYVEIVV